MSQQCCSLVQTLVPMSWHTAFMSNLIPRHRQVGKKSDLTHECQSDFLGIHAGYVVHTAATVIVSILHNLRPGVDDES